MVTLLLQERIIRNILKRVSKRVAIEGEKNNFLSRDVARESMKGYEIVLIIRARTPSSRPEISSVTLALHLRIYPI